MKHGIGLNKILGTIHIYPTLAEANKYAAGVWKRAHAPQRLLRMAGALPRLDAGLSASTTHACPRAREPGECACGEVRANEYRALSIVIPR